VCRGRRVPGRILPLLEGRAGRIGALLQSGAGALGPLLERALGQAAHLLGLRLQGREALAGVLGLDRGRLRERPGRGELLRVIQGGADVLLRVVEGCGRTGPARWSARDRPYRAPSRRRAAPLR
jgi:hypothetical protein